MLRLRRLVRAFARLLLGGHGWRRTCWGGVGSCMALEDFIDQAAVVAYLMGICVSLLAMFLSHPPSAAVGEFKREETRHERAPNPR